MTQEALRMALEAMNAMLTHMGMDEDEWNKVTFDQMRQAIKAAEEALAQTQEPVALETLLKWDDDIDDIDPIGEVVGFIEGSPYIMVKVHKGKQVSLDDDLYATPPQRNEQCNYPDCKCPTENPCLKKLAQPVQEPVAYSGNGTAGREADVKPTGFFFQMPKRSESSGKPSAWVGLTDKQTTQVIKSMPKGIKGWMIDWDLHDFSKAIEAKLKEKNT